MDRDALFLQNRNIINEYAKRITNPAAKVIIVTEPVDLLTTVFAATSSLPSHQIMGLGGILDATRLRFFIAKEVGVSVENVAAQVIGRHADDMIMLQDYCCISGVPIENFMTKEKIKNLFEQTRQAGVLIVDLARRASAYYGPSAVAADLAEAICCDTGRVMSVSQVFTGQWGISGVAMSLPCVINQTGITGVIEPILDQEQLNILKQSAKMIHDTIKEADHE
jgi:malate dehydrogenase